MDLLIPWQKLEKKIRPQRRILWPTRVTNTPLVINGGEHHRDEFHEVHATALNIGYPRYYEIF